VFYPTCETLTEMVEYCEDNDLPLDIESMYEIEGESAGRDGLNEIQYRAVRVTAGDLLVGPLYISHR
jgi:hypothetical protein